MRVFGASVLEPKDWPVIMYRDEIREFCRRHGQDPNDVLRATYEVVDLPLVRFELGVRDDNGRLQLACDHGMWAHANDIPTDHHCRIKSRSVEVALVGALPEWWRP